VRGNRAHLNSMESGVQTIRKLKPETLNKAKNPNSENGLMRWAATGPGWRWIHPSVFGFLSVIGVRVSDLECNGMSSEQGWLPEFLRFRIRARGHKSPASARMRFSQSCVPSSTARIISLRNTGSSIFASSSGLDMNACSTSIDGIQVFARRG
jgi:hypothetical protein